MGSTFRLMADYPRALDHHRQAHAMRVEAGDRSAAASSLDGMGVTWHQMGELAQAATALGEALDVRRQMHEVTNEANTLLNLAAVERDRGDPDRARESLEAALAVTESVHARIVDSSLRASYIARVEDTYASYVDVLMQSHARAPAAGHDRAAFQAAERWRARVLLESLVEARADLREGVDPALLAEEQTQQRRLDTASARVSQALAQRSSEADVAAARRALDEANANVLALRARIRASSPRYAALTQPEPLTAEQIQRDVLDPNTVLLEFSLGDQRSWLWAVTTEGITSVPLAARSEIEGAARALYDDTVARQRRAGETTVAYTARVAAADREVAERAAAMSRLLFGGIATELNGSWRGKRLAIVATGALEYLPFAALPAPTPQLDSRAPAVSLIVRHEIVALPSASVLATLRHETANRVRPRGTLAILADPVFDLGDPRVASLASARSTAPGPSTAAGADASRSFADTFAVERADAVRGGPLARLPFSREEASAIAGLAGSAGTFNAVDFRASRATALGGALANYRIVHFATHGLIDSERPELSGLVLSLLTDRGTAQNGFLRLSDIYNLRLNADLVVLSACQTALGKEIRGEGLVGLTRGFMYAGAPRVVASLWQVNDLATAELMKRFYTAMLQRKMPAAAALRAAQLELQRDARWRAPYYWAGFVLQGDWR